MKQIIEWKEIYRHDMTQQTPLKEYYFLSRQDYGEDYSKIVSGTYRVYDGKRVTIALGNTRVDLDMNVFTHYAEIEDD